MQMIRRGVLTFLDFFCDLVPVFADFLFNFLVPAVRGSFDCFLCRMATRMLFSSSSDCRFVVLHVQLI